MARRLVLVVTVCILGILQSHAVTRDAHRAGARENGAGAGVDDHAHEPAGSHEDSHGNEEGDHGHGHGGGGHGHGHGHATYNPVAGAMAKMVFGTMAFVMTLFYFVNWPDEDVQKETWSALSDMIAIFCAVLAFSAISTSMADFAETDPHAHGPPTFKAISISFGRYVVCVAVLEGVLQAFKNKPAQFKYVCTILGHVTGFAAIDVFGSLLQYEMFSQNLAVCWIGVIGFYVVIAVTAHGISFYTVDKAKGSHHWKHECMEVQSDYVSLCAGLLLSLVIRFSISGVLPPVHGAPRNKTAPMVWGLFSAALLIVPFVLGASMWKYKVHARHAGSIMLRFSETIQMTLCFATGWTLLYWGYWEFYQTQGDADEDFGPGGKMLQRLTMAIVFSVIVFACILGLDKIADNVDREDVEYAFRSLLKTCSLLMGLSWEACFNQGVQAVGLKYHGSTQTVVIVLLSVTTCAVVLPAWALYILPHAVRSDLLIDPKEPLRGFADDVFADDHGHEEHAEEGNSKTSNLKHISAARRGCQTGTPR